jgi:ABC-2 type transport system ATP-binding protein
MTLRDAALSLRHVRRDFGSHRVIQGVDLQVARGEIFALLGGNGSGKTTLLEILATLLLPSGGTALVHGHDVAAESIAVRRLVGYCPSALQSFYPRLTGAQNLSFFATLAGLDRRPGTVRVRELLERVGLGGAADVRLDRYSDGMKARLNIARALLTDPPVLLLDEPTKSIDAAGRAGIRHLLLETRRQGARTVLWVTHDAAEMALADRCGLLLEGRLKPALEAGAMAAAVELAS